MARISLQTITAAPAITAPQTSAPAITTAAAAAPATSQGDKLTISSLAARKPTCWIPLFSGGNGVRIDFTQFLTGIRAGQKLTIDGGMMVGGSGSVGTITPDSIRLNLTIKAAFHKPQDMTIDVRRQGDGYTMKAPFDWDLDVSRSGNTVTLANKANPREKFIITAGKAGQFEVQTRGLGYDGTTLTISSK